MRVFVFEYVSGGGLAGQPLVPGLVAEGDIMLAAVVSDLLAIPGVEVAICRDRRLALPALAVRVAWVDGDWHDAWAQGIEWADAVLPVAPETDGILETLCESVQRSGKNLLNSDPGAVRVAGSKLATCRRLADAGIPAVTCWPTHHVPLVVGAMLVVKPDRGVGCQGIRVLPDVCALEDFLAECPHAQDWVVQPYVAGASISLSLLVNSDRVCLLSSNVQRVVQVDEGFVLLGCVVNGFREQRAELSVLAERVCLAIAGLHGYVGIDLVLTDQGPRVLEVNPRLTTSYVGLSRSLGLNVAELLLHLAADDEPLPGHYLRGASVHVDLDTERVG